MKVVYSKYRGDKAEDKPKKRVKLYNDPHVIEQTKQDILDFYRKKQKRPQKFRALNSK